MSQLEELQEKINELKRRKIEERNKIDDEINLIKKQIAELNPKEIPFSKYCRDRFGKWMGAVPQSISELSKFACFGQAFGNPKIKE